MITKLWHACEAGLLWGVRLTLALLIPFLILWFAVADYSATRQAAQKGAAAFDFLTQQIAAQQKAAGAKQ